MSSTYQPRERFWLWLIAVAGLVGPNGVFLYSIFFRPELFSEALQNPVALAFIVDALVTVGILSYVFAKWRLAQLHWIWFVLLSLVGGLVFSIPAFLLLYQRDSAGPVGST